MHNLTRMQTYLSCLEIIVSTHHEQSSKLHCLVHCAINARDSKHSQYTSKQYEKNKKNIHPLEAECLQVFYIHAGLDELVVFLWYVRFTEGMPLAALLQ